MMDNSKPSASLQSCTEQKPSPPCEWGGQGSEEKRPPIHDTQPTETRQHEPSTPSRRTPSPHHSQATGSNVSSEDSYDPEDLYDPRNWPPSDSSTIHDDDEEDEEEEDEDGDNDKDEDKDKAANDGDDDAKSNEELKTPMLSTEAQARHNKQHEATAPHRPQRAGEGFMSPQQEGKFGPPTPMHGRAGARHGGE